MTEILSELFSSKIRASVLEFMLPRPQHGYSLTDLSRILGLPISSLQHECYKLERIGILKARREGNSRRYRVDQSCPIGPNLTSLVVTAVGQELALKATLEGIPGLELAFLGAELPLAGRLGQGEEPIPLVLVGEISLEEIDAAGQRVARLIDLAPGSVDAVFYRPADWESRIAQGSGYAFGLIDGPRTDLIGRAARAASL